MSLLSRDDSGFKELEVELKIIFFVFLPSACRASQNV